MTGEVEASKKEERRPSSAISFDKVWQSPLAQIGLKLCRDVMESILKRAINLFYRFQSVLSSWRPAEVRCPKKLGF